MNKKSLVILILIIIILLFIRICRIVNSFITLNKQTSAEKVGIIENFEEENEEIDNLASNEIYNDVLEENTIENIIVNNISEEDNNSEEPIDDPIKETTEETTEEPIDDIEETSNSQFDSSVAFIGDSRTQAFLMYTGLKNVTDYTNIGLMVDTAVTKKFVKDKNGERVTILQDLKTKNIDTIYIMLGVNELGWVYSSIFIEKYSDLIDDIRNIKPNCNIIVQSIIPVTKSKSDSDEIYNNPKIEEYNSLIKNMAQQKNVKYVDVASALADSNGNLPEEASTDGVHINKKYCLKWLECLKQN